MTSIPSNRRSRWGPAKPREHSSAVGGGHDAKVPALPSGHSGKRERLPRLPQVPALRFERRGPRDSDLLAAACRRRISPSRQRTGVGIFGDGLHQERSRRGGHSPSRWRRRAATRRRANVHLRRRSIRTARLDPLIHSSLIISATSRALDERPVGRRITTITAIRIRCAAPIPNQRARCAGPH